MFTSYQQNECLPNENQPILNARGQRRSNGRLALCVVGCLVVLGILGLSLTSSNNFLTPQSLHANQELSFGRLAEQRFKESHVWKSFESQLDTLAPGSSPLSIHKLRINTGHVRDFVDIFGPAYEHETWSLIRDNMADGYQTLGEFQDIVLRGAKVNMSGFQVDDSDQVQYDNEIKPEEVQMWRDRSLDWKESFRALDHKVHIKHYLEHPSHHHMFSADSHSRKYNRFFWGGMKGKFDKDLPGMFWIGVLLRHRLKEFDHLASRFVNLTSVNDEKSHNVFHEFRKLTRSLLAVERIVPDAFLRDAAPDLRLLQTTFHDAGKINNVFNLMTHVKHNKGHKKESKDEIKKLQDSTDNLVKKFQDWMAQSTITLLGSRLTTHLTNTGRN